MCPSETQRLLARTQGRHYGSPCAKSNIIGDPVLRRSILDPTGSTLNFRFNLSFIIQSNEQLPAQIRKLSRPNESSPTETASSSSDPANRLCLICLSLRAVLRRRLIYTFAPLKQDAVMVRWLLVSNPKPEPLLSLSELLSSWPRVRGVSAVPLSVCLRPFYIMKSSSIPLAVDMRSVRVEPSAAEKLSCLLPFLHCGT